VITSEHKKNIAEYLRSKQAERVRYSLGSKVELSNTFRFVRTNPTPTYIALKTREVFTAININPNKSIKQQYEDAKRMPDTITTSEIVNNTAIKRHLYLARIKQTKSKSTK
jgi:hypothetical protein